MKEQCKNSRLPHLLMIVVHKETLWSPAPQPMDDDDDVVSWCQTEFCKIERRNFLRLVFSRVSALLLRLFSCTL